VFCLNVTTGFGGGQERKAEQKAARARRAEESVNSGGSHGELPMKTTGVSHQ